MWSNKIKKPAGEEVGTGCQPPGFLPARDKPSFVHRWKYKFVYIKKVNGDWTILIWNKRGLNKTSNKPGTTPGEKEMVTISYFCLIHYVHPRLVKIMNVPGNWLPHQKLFDFDCFLGAAGFYLAILYGNLIIAYSFYLHSFFGNLTNLDFVFVKKAIDAMIRMMGMLTKGKSMQLDKRGERSRSERTSSNRSGIFLQYVLLLSNES